MVTDDREAQLIPLRARLVEAIAILDTLPSEPAEAEIRMVARLWNLLYDAHRATPRVTAWTATKFYRENLDGNGESRKPAIWTGHATRERAEEFAPAIQKHYIKKGGVDHGDRFKVVRRATCITDFVPEECSVEEFCRSRLS